MQIFYRHCTKGMTVISMQLLKSSMYVRASFKLHDEQEEFKIQLKMWQHLDPHARCKVESHCKYFSKVKNSR